LPCQQTSAELRGAAPSPDFSVAFEPEANDLALSEQLALKHYEVYADTRGNAFVVSMEGLANGMVLPDRALFFGHGALRAQTISTWKPGDAIWLIEFPDLALSPGARATLQHTQDGTTLICEAGARPLVLITGDARSRLLEGSKFFGQRWFPFALGRKHDDDFVYVDRTVRPVEQYRVFAGGKNHLRQLGGFTRDEVVEDESGALSFFLDGDVLHCAHSDRIARDAMMIAWETGAKTVHYVPMSASKNFWLISRELGVYQKVPSPCSP